MAGSSGRRSKGALLDAVDRLTALGLQVGGPVFILASAYLLWGILSGSLVRSASLPAADRARILDNVLFACRVLSVSGIAVIVSASARYYYEEVTGYLLLIGGALFQWGVAMVAGSTLQRESLEAARLPVYIVSYFKVVGIVALVAAVPFIVADFWFKIRGVRRTTPGGALVIGKGKDEEPPRSRLYIFCWQMPYCRDYLRKFCKAYEQRKSCWRVKSGCYCDEDMILRVQKKSRSSKLAGFDQRYAEAAGAGARELTVAQKRQRCRDCFLYREHQKQKYRLFSPLAFPAAVAIMYVYLKPVKLFLTKALEFTDQFAGRITYAPLPERAIGYEWANAQSTSELVQWLFLICIGLILVTYLLRALEYCIFDLQI